MTITTISAGQTGSGLVLVALDQEIVLSGGTASATVVNPMATVRVSGGSAVASLLGNGGLMDVYAGGTTLGTSAVGAEFVYSGGSANGTQITGGGQQVLSGGTASGTIVNSGAELSMPTASPVPARSTAVARRSSPAAPRSVWW